MGGKASIYLVMGFTVILSFYLTDMARKSTRVVENVVDDYIRASAHQIAVSGMNLTASKLYQNPSWSSGFTNIPFQGGTFSVTMNIGSDTIEAISVSTYNSHNDTVRAYFAGSSIFTKYTAYTNNENGQAWAPGDTVWGPIHTNDVFNHQNKNNITFYGKVTAGKNIAPPPKSAKSNFIGGYEVGVYLPTVNNINSIISGASSGGYTWPYAPDTMKIQFLATGNIEVYRNSTPVYALPGTPLSTLAPNGAIYSSGAVEVLGGIVNTPATGITIGAGTNIIFRDAVTYADNPETNPNSDDMIAFVSNGNIYFDNSTKVDWFMQGVLMCATGSLTAVDMNKDGTFNYYGSYYQQSRGNAKMFHSFTKKYKRDIRLDNYRPPFYPGMNSLTLVAWWE